MTHIALARKYRPRRFGDLVGQAHVARALSGAVDQNRVAHGYLLCGPRGVGKTTAARVLAMALNCETRHAGKPTPAAGEPCGECPSCERIWSGAASLDVVEIDAASNRGVDDARDLRERAMYVASQEGRHKVYIVDEAHMLTREAWNTLLKILEEPPPGVVFVFATTEPHKITNTAAPVMSRLQRFDFRRVGPHAIAERLTEVARAEQLAIAPDAVELISRIADGGLRDALSVLDQVTAFGEGEITASRVREVLGLVSDEVYAELLAIVVERRAADAFPFVAKLVEAGVDLAAFADGAADLFRAALAMRLGAKPDGISSGLARAIGPLVEQREAGDFLRILRALEDSEEAIRRGGNTRLVLETLVVRWALMDRTVDIARLLEGNDARAVTEVAEVTKGQDPSVPTAPTVPTVPSVSSVSFLWPSLLEALRAEKRMIAAQALSEARVTAVRGDVVVVSGGDLLEDALARHGAAIDQALSRLLGTRVRVSTVAGEASPAPPGVSADAAKPRRITATGARAERQRALRGKDPALDSAIDALDLELME
ncbi:MAG TPA: DNA polymerase III subunit gamma/tau [Gemmatimonadales bacterium]|nr:DNA polymerase III subunit gamma/tau [Gemmatimonadales bacterium]